MAENTANSVVARRRSRWVAAQKQGLGGMLRPRQALRVFARVGVPALLMLIWLIALLLRAFVQDRVAGIPAYLYYATPPLVLALIALTAGVWLLVVRHRTSALPVLTLSVACVPWAYSSSWVSNSPSAAPPGDTLRVLYWNVCWGAAGWDKLVAAVRERDADIIVLGEARRQVEAEGDLYVPAARVEAGRSAIYWTREMPDYDGVMSWGGVAVLVRGKILSRQDTWLRPGECVHCVVEIQGRRLHVCGVDIILSTRPRRETLARLYEVLDGIGDEPTLIAGDFNTPTDSFYLRRMRDTYQNAFEAAGNGYAPTWPWPVPLLTIDHAWFNRHLDAANCKLEGTWHSDHRMITFDLLFKEPAAAQPATAGSGV